MRYLIITYYQRPSGQLDEIVQIARRIKNPDIQSAAVILDFKTRSVVKCSMQGIVVPKDWQRIRNYYHQHYSQTIDDLEKRHSEKTDTD